MLGKIIGINGNIVEVKLSLDVNKYQNLIGYYVIMDDTLHKNIGEINDIKGGIAYINLVGEIESKNFIFGVIHKPSFGSSVKLVEPRLINSIIGVENYNEINDLYIGESPIYNSVKVSAKINELFSGHFAIFGSSGSGKSCGFARIMQNLFSKKQAIAYNSSFFIFDAYGEYHQAFENISSKTPEISFKAYTTNTEETNIETLKIPLWLLSVDDIAILLGADKHSQIPIIEKAMKFVTIFGRAETEVIKYKNDIIARALLNVLLSGRPASQVRDQFFSVLSTYKTKELNLEIPVYQPGYTRPLKQCLNIDANGKLKEMELVVKFLDSYLLEDINLTLPDGSFKYSLEDLCQAFDFALIDEGILQSDSVFDVANSLKVRLHALLDGDYKKYFECPNYMTRDEFIKSIITTKNGRKAQIINFNINYIDDRFAKTVTKIYSKLLFDYAKTANTRGAMPFHIILEEAHRYVQNDIDVELLGYNIFERIAKEGRKYAVLLGLISQRPSEMSETALSQCTNFFMFKMLHPLDVAFIHDMVPNITDDILAKIKMLQPGICMVFGTAFKLPILTKLAIPEPTPASNSCDISRVWFIKKGI